VRASVDDGLLALTFPVVLAGPSGSGKTTVGRALARQSPRIRFSTSATTRGRRPEERDGEDYRFLRRKEFVELRDRGELLEWAEVHGEWYGTPRSNLDRARDDAVHLLRDIDVQGARAVREKEPGTLLVFLAPPSGDRIVRRLRDRGSEDDEELRLRMRTADSELAAAAEFDYLLINDVLEETVDTVRAIVRAEERRIDRLGEGVSEWTAGLAREIRGALDREPTPDHARGEQP